MVRFSKAVFLYYFSGEIFIVAGGSVLLFLPLFRGFSTYKSRYIHSKSLKLPLNLGNLP